MQDCYAGCTYRMKYNDYKNGYNMRPSKAKNVIFLRIKRITFRLNVKFNILRLFKTSCYRMTARYSCPAPRNALLLKRLRIYSVGSLENRLSAFIKGTNIILQPRSESRGTTSSNVTASTLRVRHPAWACVHIETEWNSCAAHCRQTHKHSTYTT